MRTIKQIKARKRNFTIMYLTGVLTMLNYIEKKQIMKIPFMVKLKKM